MADVVEQLTDCTDVEELQRLVPRLVAEHRALLNSLETRQDHLWSWLEKMETAESRIAYVQGMRTVGELVAGFTHELNNCLTALAGYAQVLQAMPKDELPAQAALLSKISEQTFRSTALLSKFVSFARGGGAATGAPGLRGLVEETLALKAYEIRHGRVDVRVDVAAGLALPAIERPRLQQVLLNLIDNALWAVSDRDTRILELGAREEHGMTGIWVRDSGRGIPHDIMGRIFDAFFTTRPGEAAPGLGLFTSIELLDQVGGCLAVESEEGQGATFTVGLPCS